MSRKIGYSRTTIGSVTKGVDPYPMTCVGAGLPSINSSQGATSATAYGHANEVADAWSPHYGADCTTGEPAAYTTHNDSANHADAGADVDEDPLAPPPIIRVLDWWHQPDQDRDSRDWPCRHWG